MQNLWIIAQSDGNVATTRVESQPVSTETKAINPAGDANQPGPDGGKPAGSPGFPIMQAVFMGVLFVVMYMMIFRSPKKQQQKHRQMIQSLKKNDRVRTIGGIIGTVIEVKGDEVVLKVDENNNTRIHVSASAIGKNISTDKE